MIKFEELTRNHIKEAAKIYVNAFNCEPWNDKWTIESASKRISQMINCEGFYGLSAYDDGRLAGIILGNHEYYYDAMIFQIKEFCVESKVKGKGVGSKLLDEFLLRLKAKGIKRIILLTLRNNKTEGFYTKHEFEVVNDMILMEKEI